MNFFVFSQNLKKNAAFYCDKHLVKIILEVLQLLFAAVSHTEFNGEQMPIDDPYLVAHGVKKTYKTGKSHLKHPCAVAVRRRRRCFRFVAGLGLELCREYTRRYGKIHACEAGICALFHRGLRKPTHEPYSDTTVTSLVSTPHGPVRIPLCMPLDAIVMSNGRPDAIRSHRNNFRVNKRHFASYKNTEVPPWLDC